MKKLSLLLVLGLLISVVTACGGADKKTAEEKTNTTAFSIITTIFPLYDWTNHILGDNPAGDEVTMLLDSGVDLHSFQPSAEDMLKISDCDLMIYVGGESDDWIEEAIEKNANEKRASLNLMEILGDKAKEEEIVEGMQPEEHEHLEEEAGEHEHSEEEAEEHEHAEEAGEAEYDEHVWLSLKNAELLCEAIAAELGEMDPDHAELYQKNAAAYIDQLKELDAQYATAVSEATQKTLLFGDRFPFRYMTDDYGLEYYAAFAGCSAETEASFETISFLAGKVDELSLPAILTIEGTDHKIAETILENTQNQDAEICVVDSMQSTTASDVADGADYLTIMKNNLEVFKKALK